MKPDAASPATATTPPAAARRDRSIASEIADRLVDTAHRYAGECTWMGTVQQGAGEHARFSWETLGPDLYGGASGIALFLAELHARTGGGRLAETAREALRFSAARIDRVPHRFRQGFYCGRVGVALALVRGGELLDEPGLRAAGMREIGLRAADDNDDILLDVISGAAGSIGPLLSLGAQLGRDDLGAVAARLGERIMTAAITDETGWCWGDDATGFHSERPLTGYGHGAAGMGAALMELFAGTGETRFRDAAREAFRWENSHFNAARDNWPDFRYSREAGEGGHFGLAWCLGAPGIGLSRLPASVHDAGLRRHRQDAEAALRTVRRALAASSEPGSSDFSLCHGWAGRGDFALLAAAALASDEAQRLAGDIADRGAAANAGRPELWHCGLERGTHPSLMLGLAGIGYFYLRLADPTVPSLTLAGSSRVPGARS